MRSAILLLSLCLFSCLSTSAEGPNVLIMMADDLGWGDLSANGNNQTETPRLDALADEGLKFEKFYVCPTGASTSASLLTGRYHYRTGAVGESGAEAIMYGSEKTLGESFGENGYRTGWFGRWHHGKNWPHNAAGQGFQQVDNSPESPAAALEFINQQSDRPFLCLALLDSPRIADANDLNPDKRTTLVNKGIAKLDQQVGRFLDALDTVKQRENTIVVFLSDNGPDQFGDTEGRYNGYFYGGKGSVHEGGIRVPCFISWPDNIEAGSRFSRISAHIDWYPTLAELCGLESKSRQLRIDGHSLAKVLKNAGDHTDWPNRILFTSWTPPGYAVKKASVSVRTDRWVALRDPRWRRDEKILESRNGWELYDLKTDPFQSRDQGDEYPFLLSELRADFAFWMDHTTDDGIGPISIHIGHEQSPTVVFPMTEELKWPLRVVTNGNYLVKASDPCEIRIGDKTFKLPLEEAIKLTDDINEIEIVSGEITSLIISKD